MSYIATDPDSELGKVVGNGHCVAYVKQVSGAPASSLWKQGEAVRGNDLPVGTAIATFQDGRYQNATNGNSHAAIYLSQDSSGIWVYDQWLGQPVHKRLIRFRGGAGTPNNDGDAYAVVL
ncbi:MAG: BPSL0067 family protein [Acetobacteraceae bacterium]